MAIPYVVRYWLSIAFFVPSVLCAFFCLYYLLRCRTLRAALHNHVIIVIILLNLVYSLTAIVWYIDYYRTRTAMLFTRSYCLTWVYSVFAVFASLLYVVAWASIERHVLIFHQSLIATRTKRIVFHYLPLFISTTYPFVYYIFIFFVRPCQITPVATMHFCGLDSCAFNEAGIGLWDGIGNNIAPAFVIVLFSVGLLGRVWHSKYRVNQRMRWKNYRKMAVQLLSISVLYLVLLFPVMVLYTAYSAGLSTSVAGDFYASMLYMTFFIVFLTPVVSMFSLPELRVKLRDMLVVCRSRRNTVRPVAVVQTRPDAQRAATVPKQPAVH